MSRTLVSALTAIASAGVVAAAVVVLLVGCGPSVFDAGAPRSPHCADLVARALTSPYRVVPGAFGCMSASERNFWHRWAISRDDQLADVVRNSGWSPGGMVDGFEPNARWTKATYVTDLEPRQRLYVVDMEDAPTIRGLLVVTTDARGEVDGFVIHMYER